MSALFGAVVRLRNAAYDRGWLEARRLQGPVVSVGNLSVGGSGKTPFLIALGERLKQRGVAFDVLSRGYRRSTRGVREVAPDGSPEEFGDEPLLLARRLGVPVIVGERRYDAGVLAEKKFGPRLHLLDDGFQHRGLARDFDIVLVTARDLTDKLLPAGRLREPLTSLRRAHSIIATDPLDRAALPADKPLWQASRTLSFAAAPAAGSVAFCGIGRPKRFFADLRAAGVAPAAELTFPDHHRYTRGDVHGIFAVRDKYPGAGFVTTEKDFINLGPLAAELTPLSVAQLTLKVERMDELVDRVMAVVRR